MKLLLGKGRLLMKQLFLSHGTSAEVQKGLQGNTILISQPQVRIDQLMPCISNVLDSISIIFCKNKDEVRQCKALEVKRLEYLQCLHYRKQVCEAFADITIDQECLDLPFCGVPPFLCQRQKNYLPQCLLPGQPKFMHPSQHWIKRRKTMKNVRL